MPCPINKVMTLERRPRENVRPTCGGAVPLEGRCYWPLQLHRMQNGEKLQPCPSLGAVRGDVSLKID